MVDDKDFAIALADDTSTSILEKLSSHPQTEVREAVARNPNTSTKTLLKLGKEFPEAITTNPIFNLLLLENPESHFVRLSLARSITTSKDVIVRLSKIEDEEILCAVAENPKTPFDILEQLVEEPPLFYDDENADESDFDRLFIAIAHNPNTSESLFHQLADTGSTSVQIAIAENPKAPLSLLTKFADWRNFSMHKALARNPQAPIEILEKLAGENEKEIREMVKNHPNVSETAIAIIHFIEGKPGTSIDLLEKLASDKRACIRQLVAAHPSTPAKVLEKLAQDRDKDVTLKASKNRNANSTVLEFYAESLVKQCQLVSISNVQFYVRDAVELVKRSNITPKVLENLLPMNCSDVLKAIASSLGTPPDMLLALTDYEIKFVGCEFFVYLARNPNTPAEGLEKLYLRIKQWSSSGNDNGLRAIATHSNTPIHLLEKLAIDSHFDVRSTVAKNLKTPISILEQLSNDSDSRVSNVAKQALKAIS